MKHLQRKARQGCLALALLGAFDAFAEYREFRQEMDTGMGKLALLCPVDQEGCTLALQGRLLKRAIPRTGDATPLLQPIGPQAANGEMFLLQFYPGSDGCPSQYQLVHLRPPRRFYLSPPFGNCGAVAAVERRNHVVRMAFESRHAEERSGQGGDVFVYRGDFRRPARR